MCKSRVYKHLDTVDRDGASGVRGERRYTSLAAAGLLRRLLLLLRRLLLLLLLLIRAAPVRFANLRMHKMTVKRVTIETCLMQPRCRAGLPMCRNSCGAERTTTHACPARLPHRLRRRHCWGPLVRVEKLLGDLERAELAVPSEDFVVLGMTESVLLGWKEMRRDG